MFGIDIQAGLQFKEKDDIALEYWPSYRQEENFRIKMVNRKVSMSMPARSFPLIMLVFNLG